MKTRIKNFLGDQYVPLKIITIVWLITLITALSIQRAKAQTYTSGSITLSGALMAIKDNPYPVITFGTFIVSCQTYGYYVNQEERQANRKARRRYRQARRDNKRLCRKLHKQYDHTW